MDKVSANDYASIYWRCQKNGVKSLLLRGLRCGAMFGFWSTLKARKMGKEMIVIPMALLLILLFAGFMSNSKIIKRTCAVLALLIILAINVAVVDMFAAAGLFGR